MKLGKNTVKDIYFGKTRLAACFINKKLAYSPYSWGLDIQTETLFDGNIITFVDGMGSFKGSNVIIPPKYNGFDVTQIDTSAFKNCTSIESVVIPTSINYLHTFIFEGCENLKEVRYMGTIAQWNEIYNPSSLRQMFLGTQVTKIQCSDGDIAVG